MTTNLQFIVPQISNGYAYILDNQTHKRYPIKRINKPSSRFSNAHWLKSSSYKNLKLKVAPTIEVDTQIRGDIHFNVYENKIIIPKDLNYARRLS